MIDVYDMALAGLLHDIGKVMQRAEVSIPSERYIERCPQHDGKTTHQHVMWTEHFFVNLGLDNGYWQQIANLTASHHKETAFANVTDTEKYWLIQCLILGDRVSSMWDRSPDIEDSGKGAYKCKPLNSVLTDVHLENGTAKHKAFPILPRSLKDQSSFPADIKPDTSKVEEYKEVYKQFLAEFNNLVTALGSEKIGKVNFVDSVDSLMEKYFWSIPSNTMEVNPTNSLYYHSRNTAAVACALFLYNEANPDYKPKMKNLEDSEDTPFILIGGDLSGIQTYLFDLNPEHSKHAAKSLRSRSFKIKMLCDIALQRICIELNLPRQCILMNAGGKFMLLAPNIPKVTTYMEKVKQETDKAFFHEFQGVISLNLDWQTKAKFKDLKMQNFPDTLASFIDSLERAKLRKHSAYLISDEAWQTENFVIEESQYYSNLCAQCGKKTVDNGEEICYSCSQEIQLGQQIPKHTHYIIRKGQAKHNIHVSLYDDPWILERFSPGTNITDSDYVFCVKDNPDKPILHYPFRPVATALPRFSELNDNDKALLNRVLPESNDEDQNVLSFDALALLALKQTDEDKYLGVPLNAILKGDVDNLGSIFSLGLRYGSDGKKKTQGFSITQYATLSASIDWFFSAYVPAFIDSTPKYHNKIYIVYAGGDDFCLIGPWNLMLDLSIDLDAKFKAYCGYHPDLHFSAALRLLHGKSPIRFAIEKAEEDLLKAKTANPEIDNPAPKDAIYLFDTVVPWNKMDSILKWAESFDTWLSENKNESKGLSTQFLYRLLQYTEMAARYQEKQEVKDLLYKSYLIYDLQRNFDSASTPAEKIQELAWNDEEMRYMRVPLHKVIYKNRKQTL